MKKLPIHQISLPTPWPAVGPIHVYLVRQDPLTLIDTGLNMPDSREALLAGLRAHGVEPREIRRIMLTHAHLDHYGQTAWLQAESGAEVWLHPDEAGKADLPTWWLEGRNRSLTEAGVPLEVQQQMEHYFKLGRRLTEPLSGWLPLADGQRFESETGVLEAVHLPGHALGHTGFWDAREQVLVGGDHLLTGVTPNPIMEPLPPGHPAGAAHAPHRALTLGMFLSALERVSRLPVRQVLPGHGPLIDDHQAVAGSYMEKHERRLLSLRERIREPRAAYDLTREVYPRVREFDIFLALSEVLAHLDLLVDRGLATLEPGFVYRAK